jgi:peptidoglycan/LPS O-acetylase OafA/YrhL
VLALLGAAAVAMTRRFRHGGPTQRAQIKWVAAASLVLLVAEVGNLATFDPVDPYAQPAWLLAATASFALIPIAIGIAVLRYRLYEIDRIISRGLAWALLTGLLVAVFVASILVLQGVLSTVTQGETLAVAASTLVAFALFQPLRRRVQDAVDRRFNRARVDAQRAIDVFGLQLRDEVDLGAVRGQLVNAVDAAVAPAGVGVWLRGRGAAR